MLNSSVPTAKLKRLDRAPTGLNIYPRAPHLFIPSLSLCLACHHPEFCICYSFDFSKEKKNLRKTLYSCIRAYTMSCLVLLSFELP